MDDGSRLAVLMVLAEVVEVLQGQEADAKAGVALEGHDDQAATTTRGRVVQGLSQAASRNAKARQRPAP